MAYSNGYDLTAVIAALKDRVGFRQPVGTGVPTLSSAVTTSTSGRYFQDFHALVTVENIKATMPFAGANDGQLITYLGEIRQAAIMRALTGVFPGPQVVDQPQLLFQRYGQSDQLEPNRGQFVGFTIEVADLPDAAVQIDRIGVMMNGAATFNVYLFADGDPAPVWQQAVTSVANKVVWVDLSEKILNRGLYYLGFFQDDLGSVQAIRQEVKHFNTGKFWGITPMESDATGATSFDREEIRYPGEPIGLNIEISSFRDHTAQIKRKAAIFDELIGLTMAQHILEQIVYAVRSNSTERQLRDQLDRVGIQLDLNGVAPISESPQIAGLKQRIDRELKSVKASFYPPARAVNLEVC